MNPSRTITLSNAEMTALNAGMRSNGGQWPNDCVHDCMFVNASDKWAGNFNGVFQAHNIMDATYPFRVIYDSGNHEWHLFEENSVSHGEWSRDSEPVQVSREILQHTLEAAIIEANRFAKSARQLRAQLQKDSVNPRLHADVKRKALDLRYLLADVRAGR